MMNNKALLASLGVFAILLGGTYGQVSDANVEAAIRTDIKKANGDLTAADLAKVKNLDLSGLGISKVTIPEGLVNVETLDLSRNELKPSIFSPTKIPNDMTKLKSINLSSNIFPNLSLIEGLPSLETVIATNNGFDDLVISSKLANLVELDVRNNGMESITFQEGLDKLVTVNVSKNNLTDLDSMTALPALENLDASTNKFTKLKFPLLPTLKTLNLDDCGTMVSIVMPAGFDNIEIISIRKCKLAGSLFSGPVSFPNGMRNLREFYLSENELGSLTVPAGLVSLEILDIEENKISSLNFAGPLPKLREVTAAENSLKKLTLPEGLASLELFDLFDNSITDLIVQPGFPTDPEPDLDLGLNNLMNVTLPEGAPEDLVLYFMRYVDEENIFYIPLPLPAILAGIDATTGKFELTVSGSGSTGTFNVYSTTDFATWKKVGTLMNDTGDASYTEAIKPAAGTFFRIDRVPATNE